MVLQSLSSGCGGGVWLNQNFCTSNWCFRAQVILVLERPSPVCRWQGVCMTELKILQVKLVLQSWVHWCSRALVQTLQLGVGSNWAEIFWVKLMLHSLSSNWWSRAQVPEMLPLQLPDSNWDQSQSPTDAPESLCKLVVQGLGLNVTNWEGERVPWAQNF